MWLACLVILAVSTVPTLSGATKFQFPQSHPALSDDVRSFLNGFSAAEWKEFVNAGTDSIQKQKRLEKNLLNYDVTVQNGSRISHAQLLDALPSSKSKKDSSIALRILKSSLFVYNTKCGPRGISGDECRAFLETKPLPENTELRNECQKLQQSHRTGHHAFRRLLERHYRDGFQEMFDESQGLLPASWSISKALCETEEARQPSSAYIKQHEDANRNLVLVQWAQFVEHDLSKPVVTSMSDGSSIECCNREQNNLQPRYHHPACAPTLSKNTRQKYGWSSCLNYVRSALAVSDHCHFGAAEQLNQATGTLDLSQLYGFTSDAKNEMRTFEHGTLKATSVGTHMNDLLPMTTDENGHTFCTSVNVSACFVAGDSRVNSNPLSILAYTIFMRNHNRVAAELRSANPSWDEEQLFQAAKAVNIDIYRRIIMEEWLPVVLGTRVAADILSTKPTAHQTYKSEVSNEFGVAAIRFYLSMLPNVLHDLTAETDATTNIANNILPLENLFMLTDEMYMPQLQYTAKKLDDILKSLLHQHAMKMDTSYVGALVWNSPDNDKPTHADLLAFDIQRGRDHGLQPYYKYVEACHNIHIRGWNDFDRFIASNNILKLKNIYKNWTDVDLIVGGISEKPENATVGPTFNCILSEQFFNIHQCHQQQEPPLQNMSFLKSYSTVNGSKLLCLNSEVKAVPWNIFELPSDSNQMIDCDDVA